MIFKNIKKKILKEFNQKKIYAIIIDILLFEIFTIQKEYWSDTISQNKDIENIEKYFHLCSNPKSNEFHFSKKNVFPKVSIISPIYNRCEYLSRFLKSIQNQNFKDIEIILIDDFSSDNTTNLIKKYQSQDKRIILIRNKKNFGTFKCRNIGILKSTGEYIILPDPDDILSKNSLKLLYNFIVKHNYEMIRFNLYYGRKMIFLQSIVKYIPSKPIFKPDIQTFLFYAKGILEQIDFNVSNKFIKREALIRALNLLSKNYINMYMTKHEDGVLNFILYRTVKSFYFIKRIGYYYIKNPKSITSIKQLNSNTIKFIFIHLRIVFEFSINNFYEKNMFNNIFQRIVIRDNLIINNIKLMKDNIKFYIETIDIFLSNEFVSFNNKNYLTKLKMNLIKMYNRSP